MNTAVTGRFCGNLILQSGSPGSGRIRSAICPFRRQLTFPQFERSDSSNMTDCQLFLIESPSHEYRRDWEILRDFDTAVGKPRKWSHSIRHMPFPATTNISAI